MYTRGFVLLSCLIFAGCGSTSTSVDVAGPEASTTSVSETGDESSTDAASTDWDVAVADSVADAPDPESESDVDGNPTTTIQGEQADSPPEDEAEELDDAQSGDGAPVEELVAQVAEGDFAMVRTEQTCLSDRLSSLLTNEQAQELVDSSDENLEPNDPLTDTVVIVFEEIAGCMGAERIIDVLLEPEYNPEQKDCWLAAFPSEQAQIDAAVAAMTVELADLPVAPGRYKSIYDDVLAACSGTS